MTPQKMSRPAYTPADMSLDLAPRPLPLLTSDLPGTSGAARVSPEDFLVEEVPAYLPSGSGEHLYVWVEKRGLSTSEAARLLATAAGATERDIGYAGQKDRFALTRQWMSVHTKAESLTSNDERLRILDVSRHGNKLRLGHLVGNRFTLTVRETAPEAETRARAVLERLASDGLPNFYGPQRFGRRGDNAALGAALLGLGSHPEAGRARKDRFLRRLALSALQSELFNRCLAARMNDGLWHEVLNGDVLRRRESGGPFVSREPDVDRPRLLAGEVDVTGPMPGWKERPQAEDEARAREDRQLEESGISREALARAGGEAEGARRPYRVPVRDGNVRSADGALILSFELPSGAYATRVLAEILKTDLALPGES